MNTRIIISRDGENIQMDLASHPKWLGEFARALRAGGFQVVVTRMEIVETEIFPSLLKVPQQ